MENKEEEKKVTVYNIPGVIIPEQKTDKGIIKGENVINQPSQPMPINNNIQVNANNNIQNQPVRQQNTMNTINNQVPIPQNNIPINQTIIQEKQVQPLKEKPIPISQVKNNTNTNKNNQPIYLAIIIILLGISSYFAYNQFFAPKEVIDPVKELERKRSINTNSLLVQKLYNYVNLDSCKDRIDFFYGENNNILAKDLSNEVKNYLAYRQLLNKDIKKENCSNYGKALHKNDSSNTWYCGDEYLYSKTENFNDEKSITNVIDNEILKRQVESMFGPGSYKADTFAVDPSLRYLYDNKTSSYILQTFYGKNTCKQYTNKLEKSFRKGDNITITVKVTNKENKRIQMFNYTFTESEDGNYYFNSLNKQDA